MTCKRKRETYNKSHASIATNWMGRIIYYFLSIGIDEEGIFSYYKSP